MSKIHEEVIDVITEVVGNLEIKEENLDTELKKLGIDSLETFNVLFELEEKFGITFPEEDVEKLNTINSLAKYINEKLNN
ncbi:acyl carrier protein [Heliorestis acidaminivorans]|uniref:Acyl carrier protein n=1 Tax=Heliorestis acidaminivorans TaxID=553427 RepID=A0A6I0F506_9FIRM|nr:acyl carrier protein [Heliorestis acidaminivorans]KAB2953767.1 acyl carrier protein [Heliorestis acidaminivorans]